MTGLYRNNDHANGESVCLSIVYGVIRSFLLTAILVFLLTMVVFFTSFTVDHDNLHYMMIAIIMLSCFISALTAGYRLRRKGCIVGLCIGSIYALIAFGIGLEIASESSALVLVAGKFVVSMLAGALGGIIGVNV